jgi:maltose O-acetyltransferase
MKNIFLILFFPFKIIESLFYFLNRKNIVSRLKKCGNNVYIGRNCYLTPNTISIGEDVYIGHGCTIQSTNSEIIIGDHVMFGPNVAVHGGNHRTDVIGRYMKSIRLEEKRSGIDDKNVIIEDDVWIGDGAIILQGVVIGTGSVVGAGTVISKDIPPYSIVTTKSDLRIRTRFTDEQLSIHINMLRQS